MTEMTFTLFLPSGGELEFRAEYDEEKISALDLDFLDRLAGEVMESRQKFATAKYGWQIKAKIT